MLTHRLLSEAHFAGGKSGLALFRAARGFMNQHLGLYRRWNKYGSVELARCKLLIVNSLSLLIFTVTAACFFFQFGCDDSFFLQKGHTYWTLRICFLEKDETLRQGEKRKTLFSLVVFWWPSIYHVYKNITAAESLRRSPLFSTGGIIHVVTRKEMWCYDTLPHLCSSSHVTRLFTRACCSYLS